MVNGIVTEAKRLRIVDIFQCLKASTFIRHISVTFVTKIAIIIIGFTSSVITARYLGPEGKGILAVLITITGIATQFGNFGLHSSNTYFVAHDKAKLTKIISNTLWVSIFGGFIVSLTTMAVLYSTKNLVLDVPFSLMLVALLSIPFSLLFMLGQNILLGIQKIKAFNVFELSKRLATFLVIFILLALLNLGVEAVVTTTTLFAAVFALLLVKNLQSVGGRCFTFDMSLFKQMARYGLKGYLACLLAFLVLRFDMLMINYFLGAKHVGVYSIAAYIVDLLCLLPITVGMILFPKVSGMEKGSWSFTKKVVWVIGGGMFFVCLIAALLAKPFTVFFYGQAFSGAIRALWWLLPGTFLLSVNTIFMNFFAGKGMPVIVVVSPFLALVANFIMNIYLIPTFGINGASFASSIAYLIMFAASMIYLRVNPGIKV